MRRWLPRWEYWRLRFSGSMRIAAGVLLALPVLAVAAALWCGRVEPGIARCRPPRACAAPAPRPSCLPLPVARGIGGRAGRR